MGLRIDRARMAEQVRAALTAARPGSRAEPTGSPAAGGGDLYSGIDVRWVVPDEAFARAVAEAPDVLGTVQPVDEVRASPGPDRWLLSVRFRDVPLFWRLDLDVRAASAADGPEHGPAGALDDVLDAVRALARERPGEARGLLDRGFARLGADDRATGRWLDDVARLARAAGGDPAFTGRLLALAAERLAAPLHTAFFEAVGRGDADGARALLARGADVEALDPRCWPLDGETALMFAASRDDVAMVRLLLAEGADVNARPPTGWTALMRACDAGAAAAARVLLDAGADPDLENVEGYTAYDRTPVACTELLDLLSRRTGRS
ncbi:ankyrin repeat domain-containing protein [Actinomadura kijaniata]|uniref:ankyrin repeat domain-containing protein n=1 Tax=Actinomadura kijaniata TaxID=46161 RepID=UPI00082C6EAF|nr:ankyrin repeat domain-containing protein [Actinomadura kijaniata]